MSGVTPLVDTLLATRLPSRAALQLAPGQDYRDDGTLLSASGQAVTLSNAARAVSDVLALTVRVDAGVSGTEPLWPDLQQPSTVLLAAALHRTVENSGLFYESHLQQWAGGTRTLAQLMLEPQAALAAPAGDEVVSSATIHPDAVALVRQQLEVLTMPVFRWAGEAWPGMPLTWNIHEETDLQGKDRRDGEGNSEMPTTWATSLTLGLPGLGMIDARLRITGDTLQLQLTTAEAVATALLEHRGALSQRFEALGLVLTDFNVNARASRQDDDAA
jgi:hypothetical protein